MGINWRKIIIYGVAAAIWLIPDPLPIIDEAIAAFFVLKESGILKRIK